MPVLKMLLQDNEGPSTKGIGMLRQLMRESLEKRFSKLEDTKLFNQHFIKSSYIYAAVNSSHPTPSRLFTPSHSLTLQVVSEGEVLDELLRLDSRKPAGSDALDPYFFKLEAPIIAGPIADISNLSLHTSEIPNHMHGSQLWCVPFLREEIKLTQKVIGPSL